MSLVRAYFRELGRTSVDGWNRFWFAPADPATLALIRILAGAMLLYTHAVWSLRLEDFFGRDAWVSPQAAAAFNGDGRIPNYAWSYFWLIGSPRGLWMAHLAALVVFTMFTLGLFSRVTSVLSWLAAVSYVNRVPGALFGLDQINCMLAMYLMIGPCGAAYSLDRLLAARRGGEPARGTGAPPPAQPSTSANLAIRLMQIHMCVIYFFAGLGKLHGESWWFGDALWRAVFNLEYQSLDATWLVDWPHLTALMTTITVYWELFFCVLVWPRLLRPLTLALAVPLHLGIAFCLGMITFGLVMLIGCLSFVPPWLVRAVVERKSFAPGGAGQGGGVHEEGVLHEHRGLRPAAAARRKKHA